MGFISHFLAGGLFNRSEMNKKLDEISALTEPAWKLIDTIDNTVGYSGEWTAPDVFGDGSAYDLGVYMIGGGASGSIRGYPNTSANYSAVGGASGYGKNVIISKVVPGTPFDWVVGAKGAAVSATITYNTSNSATGVFYTTGKTGGTTSFGGYTAPGGANAVGGQGAPTGITDGTEPLYASFSDDIITGQNTKQRPAESQNWFDNTMITLSPGGYATLYSAVRAGTIKALPDGTKGGNATAKSNASATGASATGYGNGGGAAVIFSDTAGTRTAKSGAGSDGVIFLYARKAVTE